MLPLQSSKKKESKKERKGCNLHEMGLRPFGHSTCSTRRERGSPLWTDTQNAFAFFHLESRISVYNTTNQPDSDSMCMPLTVKFALMKQENVWQQLLSEVQPDGKGFYTSTCIFHDQTASGVQPAKAKSRALLAG